MQRLTGFDSRTKSWVGPASWVRVYRCVRPSRTCLFLGMQVMLEAHIRACACRRLSPTTFAQTTRVLLVLDALSDSVHQENPLILSRQSPPDGARKVGWSSLESERRRRPPTRPWNIDPKLLAQLRPIGSTHPTDGSSLSLWPSVQSTSSPRSHQSLLKCVPWGGPSNLGYGYLPR